MTDSGDAYASEDESADGRREDVYQCAEQDEGKFTRLGVSFLSACPSPGFSSAPGAPCRLPSRVSRPLVSLPALLSHSLTRILRI